MPARSAGALACKHIANTEEEGRLYRPCHSGYTLAAAAARAGVHYLSISNVIKKSVSRPDPNARERLEMLLLY